MSRIASPYNKVLIVDDNQSLHVDFQKILTKSDETSRCDELAASLFGETSPVSEIPSFELVDAYQGQEGLEKVIESIQVGEPFGMAFVDVRMPPGWDGIQTIEKIWEVDPDLECVICTAYSDYSLADMTSRLSGKGHFLVLKKPFDPVEVEQLAISLCEKRHLADLARQRQHDLEKLVEERTAELRVLAETDTLTQLANRSLFLESLQQCVEKKHQEKQRVSAVYFIDLDNFKLVNDSFGHNAGDELLVHVASRLNQQIRASDRLYSLPDVLPARLGGDEFAILAYNLANPKDAQVLAERFRKALQTPVEIEGRPIQISASIGYAIIDGDTTDATEILRNADTAMYDAKRKGKNRVACFHSQLHEEATARLIMESDLHTAIDQNEFELFVQPIFSMEDLDVVGHECLIRWNRADGRLVNPDEFIQTAEESGQAILIGRWVLQQACMLIHRHANEFRDGKYLCVNVSRSELAESGFVAEVQKLVSEYEIRPGQLVFEVTEQIVAGDEKRATTVLNSLHELGIRLFLDDFGAGRSSLGCLHLLPLDAIKIDQSFISGDLDFARQRPLLDAMIRMGDALGLPAIAEGIETREQFQLLQSLGCRFGQGFHLEKPGPLDKFFVSANGSLSGAN